MKEVRDLKDLTISDVQPIRDEYCTQFLSGMVWARITQGPSRSIPFN